jgi:mycofactocin system FadH/OYE family oxidoreductase 1
MSTLLTGAVAVGRVEAPSRLVFGPHETNLARGREIAERHVAYYARRAAGGAGVIVTETASIVAGDWPYERAPLASECRSGWAAVADACTPHGTIVLAGLGHTGSQGSSAYSQEVMWAPSRVADVVSREPPASLEQDGIDSVVGAFSRSAGAAVAAGLAGVEIDCGAWSLLRQFQSGLTNHRSDEYGTDRVRLTEEVLAAVRLAIGDGCVLALRMSCDELAPWAGITPEQAAEAVERLAPVVDMLTVVRAGPYSTAAYRPDAHTPATFNLDLCRTMRDAARGSTAVVLQGSVVDPAAAEEALSSGACDLVEMTRAQIAEPRLGVLVRAGTPERARPCILCNQACQVRDNRNPVVSCVMEPSSGHESEEPWAPATSATATGGPPVLVVGAGPAGLECARVLAEASRRVKVVDRSDRTGGTVTVAARGPGRERLKLATDWLAAECARLGVEVSTGSMVSAGDVAAAQAEGHEVVLATGGRPFPGRYEGNGPPAVVTTLEVLGSGVAALPPGPVVVDDPVGDQVGVGVAEWLATTDRDVTIVTCDQVAGTLLSRTGDLAGANVRLQQAGVERRLRSRVLSIGSGQVDVEDVWTGEHSSIPAAVLVDCGHRLPDDSLYTVLDDPSVQRVGDCVAPRTILEAVLEGRRAALRIVGATSEARS